MNSHDDDRTMLAESVRALLAKKSGSAAVRSAMQSQEGYDRNLWRQLCDQIGVGGITIAEDFGGSAGVLLDAAVVAEEMGRMLVPSPILGSSGLAADLIAAAEDAETQARLLPGIAAGTTVVSVCIADRSGRWFDASPGVRAVQDEHWCLTGRNHYVLDAAVADSFLVVAEMDSGIGLFEVDSRAIGVTVTGGATLDPTRRMYEVGFDHTPGRRLLVDDALGVVERALCSVSILLAAEQVGAAGRCLDLTVDYSTSRIQFGRPIGSFQALKHRMADLHVLVESARATAYSAARTAPNSEARRTEASIAKAYCSETFRTVAAECVQLHGGIAITWEHDMQLYFKRAHSSSLLFGSPDHHVAALEIAAGVKAVTPPT